MWDFLFFFNSPLLGAGLAMDAFSVSLANGLAEPEMKRGKRFLISGTFAFFQFLMPMLGWLLVSLAAEAFRSFEKAIPYVALGLLLFIGGKMLFEGVKNRNSEEPAMKVTLGQLLAQGVATSIDALAVGISLKMAAMDEGLFPAIGWSVTLIGAVTFLLSLLSVRLGKLIGDKLADKAEILGGAVLIVIGLKILLF